MSFKGSLTTHGFMLVSGLPFFHFIYLDMSPCPLPLSFLELLTIMHVKCLAVSSKITVKINLQNEQIEIYKLISVNTLALIYSYLPLTPASVLGQVSRVLAEQMYIRDSDDVHFTSFSLRVISL